MGSIIGYIALGALLIVIGTIAVIFVGCGYVAYNVDLLPFGTSFNTTEVKELIIPCLIFVAILVIIACLSDACKMAVHAYIGGTLSVMLLQDSSFADTYIEILLVAILGSAIGIAVYYKECGRFKLLLNLKDYIFIGLLLFDGLYLDISLALETVKNESHESVYLQAAGIALLITVIVGIITFVHKKQNK